MAFLDPRITNENGVKKAQVNEEKKEEKIRLSRLDDLGLCPHKAFPSKPIDRSKFESHSQYLDFLTQLKSYDKPWFIPPPTIAKRKLKLKPMQIINVHPLKKKTAKKDEQEEFEDLSKYLVLQNTCENLEKCRKRKKKKSKRLSKSGVGYSIKVTDDLAFLLRTMADAREHLVQKAIENKWREEEEERIAKEKGDIQALKNIVEGMMIKFIKIEEERLAQREMKEKQGPGDEKIHRRSSTKSDDVSQVGLPGSDNQELTKDLVGFLKSLLEADIKRKERTYEEKDTSITDLDQFLQSQEETDKVEEEAKQEEVEEEEKEKEEKEVADEEKEPGLEFEIEDNKENGEKNDDKKTDEGEGNIENEPNVDMHEVNKKLEDLVMGAEGLENEEKQVEEEEVEDEIEEWVKSIISPRPSPKIKVEASTQFDYALERKLALGIDREPKDVTEDLTVFLKTMMMADPSIREIIKEKELKEYWKKMENFDSWAGGAHGQQSKCDRKCCKAGEQKQNTKQGKNKATFKCKKSRKCKTKGKKCQEKSDSIDLDNGYCLQPKEFLMLLQGVYNTLTIAEEIDEERKHQKEEDEVSEEASLHFQHSNMEPSLLVQLTDYINEARSVIESEGKDFTEDNYG